MLYNIDRKNEIVNALINKQMYSNGCCVMISDIVPPSFWQRYPNLKETIDKICVSSLKHLTGYFMKRGIQYSVTSYNGLFSLHYFLHIEFPAVIVKRIAIQLEEIFPYYRMLDIDVYKLGFQVSRKDLDYPPRNCIACNNSAVKCIFNSTHSKDVIYQSFQRLIENFQLISEKLIK
ncbi:citrate lyase holo-[acyl-carrier protein] synthase [Xenorhabdus bovienii]|uniref:citrate lyase holo-[acyl-carrier protein] synthase n=1 Tax=Xenorhabdus bovienii TaxID=40576 RepID=UPI003DA32349